MDTNVLLVKSPVPLLAHGRIQTTWELDAPGPLVTVVMRQMHPGIVYDTDTDTGHLAILANILDASQAAVVRARSPEDVPTIRTNALINRADIVVKDLTSSLAPSEKPPALVIVRRPSALPLPADHGTPRAVLLLGPGSYEEPAAYGMTALRLDELGRPARDEEPAAVLLVRPEDQSDTRAALSDAVHALAGASPTDTVPVAWANRSVESALRLAQVMREQQEATLDSLQREVDRALDQMAVARTECEALRNSRSWRFTRLLRELGRW